MRWPRETDSPLGDGVCVVELPDRFADCLGQAAQLSFGAAPRGMPRCQFALCVA